MITELIQVEESKEEQLLREIEELRLCLDKCRKAQFAQLGALRKEMLAIKQEHEDWKISICQKSYSEN
jgi:5'-deoxynucleotidase YfbR-like HD superfamily hydrolase